MIALPHPGAMDLSCWSAVKQLTRTHSLTCQYLSMGARAGRWLRTWKGKAFENTWYRGCLAYHTKHRQQICMGTGPRRTSGTFTVKRRKLSWFGHFCRHDALPMIILQGTVYILWRFRGSPRKSWKNNIKEWTGKSMSLLLRIADVRSWAVMTAETSSIPTTPGRHG